MWLNCMTLLDSSNRLALTTMGEGIVIISLARMAVDCTWYSDTAAKLPSLSKPVYVLQTK